MPSQWSDAPRHTGRPYLISRPGQLTPTRGDFRSRQQAQDNAQRRHELDVRREQTVLEVRVARINELEEKVKDLEGRSTKSEAEAREAEHKCKHYRRAHEHVTIQKQSIERELSSTKKEVTQLKQTISDKGAEVDFATDERLRGVMEDLFNSIRSWAIMIVRRSGKDLIFPECAELFWLHQFMPFAAAPPGRPYKINALICLVTYSILGEVWQQDEFGYSDDGPAAFLSATAQVLRDAPDHNSYKRWLVQTRDLARSANPQLVKESEDDKTLRLLFAVRGTLEHVQGLFMSPDVAQGLYQIVEKAIAVLELLFFHPATFAFWPAPDDIVLRATEYVFNRNFEEDLGIVDTDGSSDIRLAGIVFPGLTKTCSENGEEIDLASVSKAKVVLLTLNA